MADRQQNATPSAQGRGHGRESRPIPMSPPPRVSMYSRFLANLVSQAWVIDFKYNDISLKASCISSQSLLFLPPGNMMVAICAQMIAHLWGFSSLTE